MNRSKTSMLVLHGPVLPGLAARATVLLALVVRALVVRVPVVRVLVRELDLRALLARALAVPGRAARALVFPRLVVRVPVAMLVLLLLAAAGACGQSGAGGGVADPAALMTLAHEKNGLTGPDVKPWHIRARYSAFELNGQFDYQGTFEEWWIDATHYKIRYTNPRFGQTEYATGTALYRDGSADWVGGRELRMRTALLDPLPVAAELGEYKLSTPAVGGGSVQCVLMKYAMASKVRVPDAYFPMACFEPSNPVLRVYTNLATEEINFDGTVLFDGHYVARQLEYVSGGRLAGEMQVDVLEPLKQTAAEVLAVPPSAQPVDLTHIRFTAAGGTGTGGGLALLERALPRQPLQAADSPERGGVVDLEAGVGADGRVTDLKLLSAKNVTSEAAMEAVRSWRLAPFMVMGQARPIEVEISLLFAVR